MIRTEDLQGRVMICNPAARRDLRWNLGGEPRLLGYSSLLIQDSAGAFTGAGITFQDITKPGVPA